MPSSTSKKAYPEIDEPVAKTDSKPTTVVEYFDIGDKNDGSVPDGWRF